MNSENHPVDGSRRESDSWEERDFEDADHLVRKRQVFDRRPKSAKNLVTRLMARKGYNQQQSTNELSEAWDLVAADQWRNQTQVGNIRRGILEVIVTTSALNQRLEFEKKRLLAELKKQLPQTNLKDIRFRIGNLINR